LFKILIKTSSNQNWLIERQLWCASCLAELISESSTEVQKLISFSS